MINNIMDGNMYLYLYRKIHLNNIVKQIINNCGTMWSKNNELHIITLFVG